MKNLRYLSFFFVVLSCSVFNAPAIRAQDSKVPEGMVLVPAGAFLMGTNNGEGLVPEDPQPQHSVTLPDYYIDKTEVTNAEYKKYCDATGYTPPPHWINGAFPSGEENFPVTHVNWFEATAYARWIGKRLPTEAEWEKAARGTDGREYPWGAWDVSRTVNGQNKPSAVGSKPNGASPYGALDLAGNVFEWTSDWYRAYPGSKWVSPFYGTTYKIIRGGAFDGGALSYKSTYRCVMPPNGRIEWAGFRCALSPTA